MRGCTPQPVRGEETEARRGGGGGSGAQMVRGPLAGWAQGWNCLPSALPASDVLPSAKFMPKGPPLGEPHIPPPTPCTEEHPHPRLALGLSVGCPAIRFLDARLCGLEGA